MIPLQNLFFWNVCDLWINAIWLIYKINGVIPKEINISIYRLLISIDIDFDLDNYE